MARGRDCGRGHGYDHGRGDHRDHDLTHGRVHGHANGYESESARRDHYTQRRRDYAHRVAWNGNGSATGTKQQVEVNASASVNELKENDYDYGHERRVLATQRHHANALSDRWNVTHANENVHGSVSGPTTSLRIHSQTTMRSGLTW